MPITSANSIATSESSTVAGKRAVNSENTGSWVMSEMPRSPCSAFQTYSPYCTGKRPVEAELVHQPLVALLGHAALARQRLDRIARDQADQGEDEQRDAEEGRDDEGEALEDEGEHQPQSLDGGVAGCRTTPVNAGWIRARRTARRIAVAAPVRWAAQDAPDSRLFRGDPPCRLRARVA